MVRERDHDWIEAIAGATPAECVPVAATDPLYILYTSGTTGIPKGVVRDNGGHAVALKWSMGSVYGMVAPLADLPRQPGEWESFDITLVGRYVTIARNGVTTIDNQEIAGITGGALDSHEAEPGPFYFQGDHTGGMKYRNITLSLPKR